METQNVTKSRLALSNLSFSSIATKTAFAERKKKGRFFHQDFVMIFQSLVKILPPFFDFERLYLSPWAKFKKSEATFVAMRMLNKCAKHHGDCSSG